MTAPVSVSERDEIAKAIDRAGDSVAISGNQVELLIDGPDNYAAMHALIAGATRRIHCENYIIRDDTVGRGFAAALAAKARAGIRVRVLYDWFGSISTSASQWRTLRQAGAEVLAFSPPRLRDPLAIINRDHRKLLSADGLAAITGGLCIGDEWVGDPAAGDAPWRDTGIRVEGPAARAMDHAFAESWRAAGGEPPNDSAEVDAEVAPAGNTAVRVVATRPGNGRAWRVLDLILGLGTERIWVTDAYLAAPARLYQVFQDAAAAGVDVRLLLPGGSDLPLVRDISRTGYRRLLRSRVRIWEWGGNMLHAKTMTIDGRWVRVGSSNLNPSSLVANWEIDLFIDDPSLAERMELQFATDLEQSGEVVRRPRGWSEAAAPTRRLGRRPALVVEKAARRGRPRGLLERRKRAVIRATALIRAARAVLLATASGVLLLFALLLVVFPRLAAYTTAAILGLVAVILLASSFGRRRGG